MTLKELRKEGLPISILKLEDGEIKSVGYFEHKDKIPSNLIKMELNDQIKCENDGDGEYYEAWIGDEKQ